MPKVNQDCSEDVIICNDAKYGCVFFGDPPKWLVFLFCLVPTKTGTLTPTNMAPDRGSLQKEIDLPGTLPQMLCFWEEGYPEKRNMYSVPGAGQPGRADQKASADRPRW